MTQPNIVVILADDLGYGDIGLYGNPAIRTPNLDHLGQTGIRLDQHYAASPLCAPSRAAFLTGRYHHRTGAVDVPSNRGLDRIHLREQTMADLFASAGYATGMVGKWHNGVHDLRYHPNARGFKEFAGFLNGGMDYYNWVLDRNNQAQYTDGRYLTDVFTDEAVSFIDRHSRSPFFLYVAYNAPHVPLQAPAELISYYEQAGLPTNVAILYAMIEQLDTGVGRILEALKRQGLTENTLVLFSSDNGPQMHGGLERFNGPFRGVKGQALEGGVRVPCLLRWPAALPGGIVRHEMTHFTDWLPTLAACAGIKPTGQPLDGVDISPLLRGQNASLPTVRYWQHNRYTPVPRCNGGMRDHDWKLYWPMRAGADWKDRQDNEVYLTGMTTSHQLKPITDVLPQPQIVPAHPPQLFNLAADPGETQDLSAQEPQQLSNMIRSWDTWWDNVTRDWQNTYRSNVKS